MIRIKKILFTLLGTLIGIGSSFSAGSPKCTNNRFCNNESLGDQFDYRGQSTYGRLSPGDTTRVKVVLYSNNDVRIALCTDQILGDVSFKIIKTVREYNRIIERIEKTQRDIPVFKFDESGNKIVMKTSAGNIQKDEYGEIKYEIANYVTEEFLDTIWTTERNIREEVVFNSKAADGNKDYYQSKIDRTSSVIIEVVVPPIESNSELQIEGCVGIMVGRKFTQNQ